MVLALIIIPTMKCSFSPQEQNTQEQQQKKNTIITICTQNLTDKNEWPNIPENVITDFTSNTSNPKNENTAFIHPFAVVIGACSIGDLVMVAPTAVCRGDEVTPIDISAHSNLQDDVIPINVVLRTDGQFTFLLMFLNK